MDDKKKKFMIPEVEVVNFVSEDIITKSLGYDSEDETADWEDGPSDNW